MHLCLLLILCSQAYTAIVGMTYGLSITSDDDDIITLFDEALARVVPEGAPGACIIDLFPFRESAT